MVKNPLFRISPIEADRIRKIWSNLGFFIKFLDIFRILPYMGVGRLTKSLPAMQSHFWEFFGQPFGENKFSKNASQQNCHFNKKAVILIELTWGLE